MHKRPLSVAVFAIALAVLATSVTPAFAAKRKVPFGFFGTVFNIEADRRPSDTARDQQMDSHGTLGRRVHARVHGLAGHRAEAGHLQLGSHRPRGHVGRSSRDLDPAATCWPPPHGRRAKPQRRVPQPLPAEGPEPLRGLHAHAHRALRPKGTFWAANPTVPKVPIRQWQIWNEQMAPWFWDSKPWAPSYVKLLKVAYRAIHKADRGAKVVAGSLVGVGQLHASGTASAPSTRPAPRATSTWSGPSVHATTRRRCGIGIKRCSRSSSASAREMNASTTTGASRSSSPS